jgi:hypothetical protein
VTAASRPSEHAASLEQAYRAVGDRTWAAPDFLDASLAISRDLFTPESLLERRPRPRELEVVALLSGLPFPPDIVPRLVHVQEQISAVLGPRLHYWVAPANFGLEYCVFKWPAGPWNPEWLEVVRQVLAAGRHAAFRFEIGGIQVNPDGCVVAKGFDEGGEISRVRERLRAEIPFLPEKQSAWAHVPLGRILEPLGTGRFAELGALMRSLANEPIAATKLDSMQLVHETRWYMEQKQILEQYPLAAD